MLRILLFCLFLIVVAAADAWFIERPGEILINWQGYHIKTSLAVGVLTLLLAAFVLMAAWTAFRFVFRLPAAVSVTSEARRRNKGFAALSRGLVAVNAGDAETARKAALDARRHLRHEPLALLLQAQAAQLTGEQDEAEAAYKAMTRRSDMRLIGLRGLHAEAHRRGDHDEAHHFAAEAHGIAKLPWTSQAVVHHRAAKGNWQTALDALENSTGGKQPDRKSRERQRAVLETAIAMEKAEAAPDEALRLARQALKREPNFVPTLALCARLMNRKGEARKAAKLIEAAWAQNPHPDLAAAYVEPLAGETAADRLRKAQSLARIAPRDPESRMTLARAAIAAGEFSVARDAMQPLIEGPDRPTIRMCHIMADLEEAEHGASGYVREWLARGARAPHDPAWVADGIASERWLPASPATGRLDAFVWRRPIERLSAEAQPDEAVFAPAPPPPPQLDFKDAGEAQPLTGDPAPAAQAAQGSASADKKPARPVVFPLPGAPDDPGMEKSAKPQSSPPLL